MKRGLIFLIVLYFSISFISASYQCTDNGTLLEDRESIDIGEILKISKLKIILIDSSIAATGTSADILIDSAKVTLTTSSSVEVELLSGDYNISLINITDNLAYIKVETDEEEIEDGERKEIDGLQVYAKNIDDDVDLYVGKEYLFLYSSNPSSTNTIDGIDYFIELLSSSNDAAIIKVRSCKNGSLIEINDTEIVNDTIDNSSLNNSTEINDSENQGETNESETQPDVGDNSSVTQNDSDPENLEPGSENTLIGGVLDSLKKYVYYIIAIVFIVIVALIVLSYMKNRGSDEEIKGILESKKKLEGHS